MTDPLTFDLIEGLRAALAGRRCYRKTADENAPTCREAVTPGAYRCDVCGGEEVLARASQRLVASRLGRIIEVRGPLLSMRDSYSPDATVRFVFRGDPDYQWVDVGFAGDRLRIRGGRDLVLRPQGSNNTLELAVADDD